MLTAHRRGMQGISARDGLPKIRADWVAAREARGDKVCTQQHYAKRGIITEEMAFCAARERIDPEFVRSEVCMHPPRPVHAPHTGHASAYAGPLWFPKLLHCPWLIGFCSAHPGRLMCMYWAGGARQGHHPGK